MAIGAEWLEFIISEAKAEFSRQIQSLNRCIEEFLQKKDYEKFNREFQEVYAIFIEVLPIINQNLFDQITEFTTAIPTKIPMHLSTQQQIVFFIAEFVKKLSNLGEDDNLDFELTNSCNKLNEFVKTFLNKTEDDDSKPKATTLKSDYQLLTEQAKNHTEEIEKWLKELENIRTSVFTGKRRTFRNSISIKKNYKLDFIPDSLYQRGQSTNSIIQGVKRTASSSHEILKSIQDEILESTAGIQANSNSFSLSTDSPITSIGIFSNKTQKTLVPFADPNIRNKKSQTPLHLALEKKEKLEHITMLVAAGANIHASDEVGNSVMHYVVKHADVETMNWFLEKNVDAFVINHNNETLLHVYMYSNLTDLAILERLIKTGIDIKARDIYKNMPLHVAADFDKVEYCQSLVNRGVDINARGAHDSTALHIATLKQHQKTLFYLLEAKNIDVTIQNKSGETFLHLAVKLEVDILSTILQKFDLKNCINILNRQGKTALDIALEKKKSQKDNETNKQIIKILQSKGAKKASDVKKSQDKNNENNNFFQSVDVFSEIQANKCNISALVQNLISINIRNEQNQTLLHFTVLLNKTEDITFLLKNRISINATSQHGNTALHNAILIDNNDIILMLLAGGARLDIINQQNLTPLHVAAIQRKYEEIKLIVEVASDQAINNAVNLQNGDGNTVAHLLILHAGKNETQTLLEIIKLLLENHLLLHTLNAKGQNLLDCAKERNITSLMNFLIPFYEPQAYQPFQEKSEHTYKP